MEPADIKDFAERQPFRPFAVRLTNGAKYSFKDPKDFGAPKDYHVIVHFGESELVLIDTDTIAEIMQR